GMRGIGDIRRRTSRLQLVVKRDRRLYLARIETVENRDRGVFQLRIRFLIRISFDYLLGQPGIAIERTVHRGERLLRRNNQRGVQPGEYAVYGLLDLPHIFMQQRLLAFQVLQPAALSPYVKGRTPCRLLGVPRQVWNLQPHWRKIDEGVDQPDAFFRQCQHEDIVRRRHGAYQWRQMQPVRHLGQRFWRVGQAKQSHQAGGREYRQPMRLIVPEGIERVRLGALELSDLVFILNVTLKARQMIEPFLEIDDLALVDAGFPELRQCLSGEIPECDAI